MLRKLVTIVVVAPLAIAIVAFAVANRQAITVSLDPFDSAHPAYSVTLPLFAIVFAILILGVVVGGVAAWLRQGSWRRSARRLDNEVRRLHEEIRGLRTQLDGRQGQSRPDLPQLPPASPP
ncbi:MAG: LapA family protein [Pseudolabrys sp.]